MPQSETIPSNTELLFDNLHYQINGTWQPIPEWASFFLKLGSAVSCQNKPNTRFVLAISLPTRAYASVLLAGGVSCSRALLPYDNDNQEYFEKLISLDDGTPLLYRKRTRKLKGRKCGVIEIENKPHIGIQIDEGLRTTDYIGVSKAKSVEMLNQDTIKLPLQQKGREISQLSPLVKGILGDNYGNDFTFLTRLDNIVIGPIISIRLELKTILMAGEEECGEIGDLVRARRFLPSGAGFRTIIRSSVGKVSNKTNTTEIPYLIIFDGGASFVKWGDGWRNNNWVVILDQTERNFNYAVQQVNNEYSYRSIKQHKVKIPHIPAGIEIMFFTADL